jgi:hypothetical protein
MIAGLISLQVEQTTHNIKNMEQQSKQQGEENEELNNQTILLKQKLQQEKKKIETDLSRAKYVHCLRFKSSLISASQRHCELVCYDLTHSMGL